MPARLDRDGLPRYAATPTRATTFSTSICVNARKSGSGAPAASSAANHSACTVDIPSARRSGDVLAELVADEERLLGRDAELRQRTLEDRRLGLAGAGLVREDRRVDPLRDAQPLELGAQQARRLGPGVRHHGELQAPAPQRLEQRMGRRGELPRRLPDGELRIDEAVELVVGRTAEQAAQRRPVVGAGDELELAKAHRELAGVVPPDRRETGAMPLGEELVVPFEARERVVPVEKDGLQHGR